MMRGAAFCLLCLVTGSSAQDRTFRAETNVVQVPVSVKDTSGRDVENLLARHFTVLDNGVPQQTSLDKFGTGVAPISLAIAIQSSGIAAPALVKIRRIGGMIQPLVIGDRGEAAIVTFDREIQWRQDFTSSSGAIQAAVKALKTGEPMEARMLDAVVEIADRMKARAGRKVLLLISESRDRGSQATFQQALEAVAREGIEVFGAHYSAYSTTWIARPEDLPPPSAPNFLAIFTELARAGKTNDIEALTDATGGFDYPFLKARGIEQSIEKLGVEVHSQYFLSFPRREGAPGMHRIEVAVPGQSELRIRSRRAYWAD
jgi:VWFA-related protein